MTYQPNQLRKLKTQNGRAHKEMLCNPHHREPSKSELRAQFAEAVRNTADLQAQSRDAKR